MLLSEVVCDLSKNYYQSIEWQCFVLNSFSIGSCLTAFGSDWNIAVCAVCFNGYMCCLFANPLKQLTLATAFCSQVCALRCVGRCLKGWWIVCVAVPRAYCCSLNERSWFDAGAAPSLAALVAIRTRHLLTICVDCYTDRRSSIYGRQLVAGNLIVELSTLKGRPTKDLQERQSPASNAAMSSI